MASTSYTRKDRVAPEFSNEPHTKKHKKSKTSKSVDVGTDEREFTSKRSNKDEFQRVKAQMTVNIPALYSGPGRPREAVLEMLDSMLMRYIPNLRGVVLAHSDLEFLSPTAMFLVDSPFARVDISFTATVWSPKIGSKLRGKINICSPDHIGLLVHQTFNASIPRHHIPSHEWEFEYGALENDPEYGWGATGDGEEEARGRWVHKVSGEVIGSDGRPIEFTIIGLNISHSMLSLIGSIQPDPFSPEHKPLPAMSHASPAKRGSRSMRSISEEASVHNALTQDDLEAYETEAMDGDEAMEYDMDGGPSADEREAKRQAELEKQEKREKKRKRREERKSQKTGQDGDMTGERKRKKKKKDDE